MNLKILFWFGLLLSCLVLLAGSGVWWQNGAGMMSGLLVGNGMGIGLLNAGLAWVLYRDRRSATADLLAHQRLLQNQANELQRVHEVKHKILAAASHDLRQPLSALNFFLEDIRCRLARPEDQRTLDSIQISVGLIGRALNNLLDITRLESDRFAAQVQTFGLSTLFARLADEFMPQAAAKGVWMAFPPSVQCHGIQVRSDPTLLRRILEELLSNAVKFTTTGNIQVLCEVGAVPPGQQHAGERFLRLAVSDSGHGIPRSEHDAIFVEFYQLDNPERDRHKGMGLGLALVKQAARLLNHPLHLHSVPDQGTCLSLYVPMDFLSAPNFSVLNDAAPSQEQSANIIFIEDDAMIRTIVSELLQNWGYRVLYAASIEQALGKLGAENFIPQLMITDYRLCNYETGIQAIESIRAHFANPDLPCIILTGDSDPEREREAAAHHCELLQKPSKPAHLRKLIRYYLRTPQSEGIG